jgi:hypothetical protein
MTPSQAKLEWNKIGINLQMSDSARKSSFECLPYFRLLAAVPARFKLRCPRLENIIFAYAQWFTRGSSQKLTHDSSQE